MADLIKDFEAVFYYGKMGGEVDRRDELWLEAVPDLEQRLAGRTMFSDIMSKLCKGKSSAQLSCWKLQKTRKNCLIS